METRRQALHIAVGGFAFLLRWLTWPQAALLATGAITFNLLLLPRLAPGVVRRGERGHPWTSGLVVYPMAVLALVLLFRSRLDLAATAWAVLAAGDGMATLIGANTHTARLPWNRDKSVGGLVGFLLAGSVGAVALQWWTGPTPADSWLLIAAVAAAVASAFAETIPIRLDDNITVPAVAAAVLWSASVMNPSLLVATFSAASWWMLAINVAVAMAGWAARTVTPSGAVTGALIGTVIIIGAGVAGWVVLIATFVFAAATTRLGHARKDAAGIAEERGGRRGPGNAIANTGAAAYAAVVAAGMTDPSVAWLALVAALSTAGSDTVASEVGKAWGRATILVTSFRRVPPGTPGAISVQGTAAGVVSAAALAALGAWLGLVPWTAVALITGAATIASFLEGVLADTLEARGILSNDAINFVNAAMGAALTVGLWATF
jgi:uncharacterized protein (TIGR00297 family)